MLSCGNCSNKSKVIIDANGQLKSPHVQDSQFDLVDFLLYLSNKKNMRWKDIFWQVWLILQEFNCQTCNTSFHGMQIDECLYHPDEPQFDKVKACSNKS